MARCGDFVIMHHHHFISDLHLDHAAVLRYDNRPFANVQKHDDHIADRCVFVGHHNPNSTLWLLGDIARTQAALVKFMERIRPHWRRIHLIRGNHDDRVAWKHADLFDEAHEARYLRISPHIRIYLSHYAHRVWRNSHHGSFHLHGHSHGALPRWGRSMDVSANVVDYTPISVARVVHELEQAQPINHHQP